MKKILFAITLLLISLTNVNAEECDAYDIKRLKEIANGVEITYELQEPYKYGDMVIKDEYLLSINGLTEEIYINNKTDNKKYFAKTDMKHEKIYGGIKQIQISSVKCNRNLREIVLNIPAYNIYSQFEECKIEKNSELSICSEWVEEKISDSYFKQKIAENMEENEQQPNFIKKYYIIIIGGIVSVFVVIFVVLIIKRKKEVLA